MLQCWSSPDCASSSAKLTFGKLLFVSSLDLHSLQSQLPASVGYSQLNHCPFIIIFHHYFQTFMYLGSINFCLSFLLLPLTLVGFPSSLRTAVSSFWESPNVCTRPHHHPSCPCLSFCSSGSPNHFQQVNVKFGVLWCRGIFSIFEKV